MVATNDSSQEKNNWHVHVGFIYLSSLCGFGIDVLQIELVVNLVLQLPSA